MADSKFSNWIDEKWAGSKEIVLDPLGGTEAFSGKSITEGAIDTMKGQLTSSLQGAWTDMNVTTADELAKHIPIKEFINMKNDLAGLDEEGKKEYWANGVWRPLQEFIAQKVVQKALDDPMGHNLVFFLNSLQINPEDVLLGRIPLSDIGNILVDKVSNLVTTTIEYGAYMPARYVADFNSYSGFLVSYLTRQVTSAPADLISSTAYWTKYYTVPLRELIKKLNMSRDDNQQEDESEFNKKLTDFVNKVKDTINEIQEWWDTNIGYIFESWIGLISEYWNNPEKLQREMDNFLMYAEANTFGQLGQYADTMAEWLNVQIDQLGEKIGKGIAEIINKAEEEAYRWAQEKLAKVAANAISTAKTAIAEAANMLISTLGPAGKVAGVAIRMGMKAIPFPEV